jgi:hypothetical protein
MYNQCFGLLYHNQAGISKEPGAYLKLKTERLLYTYIIIEKGISHDHGN